MSAEHFDAVILGAGGAGMMCAIHAGRRHRSVAVLDHATKVGGKIIISGGGRCNFTNLAATPKNYVSCNEHFCKSALSRFTPEDFVAMVREHGIPFHERRHRQLFCDGSAKALIDMLKAECDAASVRFFLGHKIGRVERATGSASADGAGARFTIETDRGKFTAHSLVVATGGLSIPKMGATGFGYELATQFGLKVTERAPALDGFVLAPAEQRVFDGFAGIAFDATLTTNGITFRENLLFTHAGLSGPVSLQASLHWYPGDEVRANLLPAISRDELISWFNERRSSRSEVKNLMSELVPKRLAERFHELYWPAGVALARLPKKDLEAFCAKLQDFVFVPASTVGYSKAEVTRGGVDTDELSSKTMEARKVPGLYFIGEVVDVTGWLGGFNYQWAWASGSAAGTVV